MAPPASQVQPGYDDRVFINCPFDDKYKPILDGIVFAIHDLGFQARHALIDNGTVLRVQRIAEELRAARYSVHDISRVEVSETSLGDVPRFNMPFEAGIAYALHAFPMGAQEHHLAVLDSTAYRYQASISDLNGLDAKIHEDNPLIAISCIREFLQRKSGITDLPGAEYIIKRFNDFKRRLPKAAVASRRSVAELQSMAYFNDLQALMAGWIAENPP